MIEFRKLRFRSGGGAGKALLSGVIVRHLVLPGYLESTREVLRWFAGHCRGRALLSLMAQYTPVNRPGEAAFPDRPLDGEEYGQVLRWLEEFRIEDGFYQEPLTDSGWLPDFDRVNPFSSDLSEPVWHWKAAL
jgi:putative pyruvate formate lyase activating enzyme